MDTYSDILMVRARPLLGMKSKWLCGAVQYTALQLIDRYTVCDHEIAHKFVATSRHQTCAILCLPHCCNWGGLHLLEYQKQQPGSKHTCQMQSLSSGPSISISFKISFALYKSKLNAQSPLIHNSNGAPDACQWSTIATLPALLDCTIRLVKVFRAD